MADARQFIERYFGSFPRVRDWRERTLAEAREKGFVETILGRRRPIPEIRADNPRVRAQAENVAVNTPVQGSAADIIKRAMIDLERRLETEGLAGRMLLQVHDELLLEVPLAEVAAHARGRGRLHGARRPPRRPAQGGLRLGPHVARRALSAPSPARRTTDLRLLPESGDTRGAPSRRARCPAPSPEPLNASPAERAPRGVDQEDVLGAERPRDRYSRRGFTVSCGDRVADRGRRGGSRSRS